MAVKKATTQRKRKLVIVESPSKARIIGKFLGSGYKVIASVGHVRDLPKSKLGIDIEQDFEPQYINIRGKGDVIRELKGEAKKAGTIFLATDPDREGEAISWHLAHLLDIDPKAKCRVTFNEITKSTVKESIKSPRAIDQSLVDAQQARRVLDRLVGYQISPILWQKVRRGLSAGRVQSAALKMICDREKEIQAFVPKEYWDIFAEFKNGKGFKAKLETKDGAKLDIPNAEEKDKIIGELEGGDYVVSGITKSEKTVKPFAPYTTSSLQQDAANRINFNTKKTMLVAQHLYEGKDLGSRGSMGLITYLRTDSVRVSDEARRAAKEFIISNYGEGYHANQFYGNKKGSAQDAHEAIRPTMVDLTPDEAKKYLTADEYKLYNLIWQRFVASQMASARFDTASVNIENGAYGFKANGSKMTFDGYRKVYKVTSPEDKDKMLPELAEGQVLDLKKLTEEQKFTQPPSRFTEASLVRELENKGIGRPSTYAPIVGTLTERRYVRREKKSLVPTDLGNTVDGLMEDYFRDVVDVDFTREMEDRLDSVEEGESEWKSVIRDFYGPFEKELKAAEKEIEKVVIEDRPTGEVCELCGKPMVYKAGRFGDFIACSGYPECKNTKAIIKTTGVKCPNCGKDILEKRSKRGRIFYGCAGFPECKVSFWNKPVDRKCPKCGSLLVERKGRRPGLNCSNEECGYKE